ncbi:DUF4332 domain-containing protein [Candidatus Bathyarchaeota archaeon]|jgi:uncharacterized protein (DUF488 family)|nr:MAG: DUF4332 domain-containing protein [Candidatus Bathyarchaeota archaeon]
MVTNSAIVVGVFVISTLVVLMLLYFETKSAQKEREQDEIKIRQTRIDETQYNNIEQESDLEYLKNISSKEIKILQLEEIRNIMEFKARINTEDDIMDYSIKLGIHKRLVEDWVRLGEFSRLRGMTQDYLNLLEKAGITSLSDLSDQEAFDLLDRIKQVSEFEVNLLSIGMLSYWIRNAKQTDLIESTTMRTPR